MREYIDRQEAIDALEKLEVIGPNNFKEMLKKLPTANVREAVAGKWIIEKKDEGYYADVTCPVCGFTCKFDDRSYNEHHFCPGCGAKLEGDENEF